MFLPELFMNYSGKPVKTVVNLYKILVEQIVVFYDDMDLEFGKIRVKTGGGSAGHKGITSLDQSIGKNYTKCRIGIGKPKYRSDVSNYVLSNFSKMELKLLQKDLFCNMLEALPEIFMRINHCLLENYLC